MITSKARKQAEKDELLLRVSAWEVTRPKAPYSSKPEHTGSSFGGMHIVMLFVGFLIGVGMVTQDGPAGASNPWIIFAPLWVAVACFIGSILLDIAFNCLEALIYSFRSRVWKEYEVQLDAWRAEGRKEFKNHLHDPDMIRRVSWS